MQHLHTGKRLRPLAELANGRVRESMAAENIDTHDAAEDSQPESRRHGIVQDEVGVLDWRSLPRRSCRFLGHFFSSYSSIVD